jgi:hypothetical protein
MLVEVDCYWEGNVDRLEVGGQFLVGCLLGWIDSVFPFLRLPIHHKLRIIPQDTQVLHAKGKPARLILLLLNLFKVLTQNVSLPTLVLVLVLHHKQTRLQVLEVQDLL